MLTFLEGCKVSFSVMKNSLIGIFHYYVDVDTCFSNISMLTNMAREFCEKLPKIELHAHLNGSMVQYDNASYNFWTLIIIGVYYLHFFLKKMIFREKIRTFRNCGNM